MLNNKFISLPVLMAIVVTGMISCFKDDQKVAPHVPGNVHTVTIAMEQSYKWQVYFDLSANVQRKQNDKNVYDLAFECRPDRGLIWLNTAAFMRLKHTGMTDFESVTDTTLGKWAFDKSTGQADSNAIGYWYDTTNLALPSFGEVMVIDRGIDALGNYLGFWKIKLLLYNKTDYQIRFSKLKGGDDHTVTVTKSAGVNYVYLSFLNSGEILNLEPVREQWDMIFTQYTTLLYTDMGEAYPYLVTGALSNPYLVEMYEDTTLNFNTVTLADARKLSYSADRDLIGYDWKDVVGDVTSGNVSYQIRPKVVYIIRDHEGLYFKLRFTGFYSNSGEKGYPAFEFAEL